MYVYRKRRGSKKKMNFKDIFFSFLCQKYVNLVPNSYFCCSLYLFGESCSLTTFEKNWNICQSQKQIFAFKLDNFWLSELFRSKGEKWYDYHDYQNDVIQNKINNLVSIAIFLLCNKMLSGHKKVEMVLEMKFLDKTKSKRFIKMIVGRHYCYKRKGIYSGTCSM